MRLVIADTGPVNYLILIGEANLLPALFERIALPATVRNELTSPKAPRPVREWAVSLPGWVEVHHVAPTVNQDLALSGIDAGERAAIQLAETLRADLLLMDDRKGVFAAQARRLRVTGTLGVPDAAARRGLVDFAQAVRRLRQTSFRIPEAVLDTLLSSHSNDLSDGT